MNVLVGKQFHVRSRNTSSGTCALEKQCWCICHRCHECAPPIRALSPVERTARTESHLLFVPFQSELVKGQNKQFAVHFWADKLGSQIGVRS